MTNEMELIRKRMAVMTEVLDERWRQDDQWGGPAHDDDHTANSDGACWRAHIARQSSKAATEHYNSPNATDALMVQRARYVKMAALAIAGIESIDRITKDGGE